MTPACSQLELHYTACSLHAPCTLYLPQATPVTISFELHCRSADRCELQFKPSEERSSSGLVVLTMAPSAQAWCVASATLRPGKCTKGGLEPGHRYAFRARGFAAGAWGAWGSVSEAETSLAELPQRCSAELRVPAMAVAARVAEATQAAERRQLAAERHAVGREGVEAAARQEEAATATQEATVVVAVGAALRDAAAQAEAAVARAVMAAKAKLAKAAEAEETVCDNQREGGDNQREVAEAKLDEEMASRLCEIENGLGTAQLSAVRRARQEAEATDATLHRLCVEAGIAQAVHAERLQQQAAAALATKEVAGEVRGGSQRGCTLLWQAAWLRSRGDRCRGRPQL